MRLLHAVTLPLGLGLALLAGCSRERPPPPMSQVTGSVMLDGQPLASGEIFFISAAGQAAVKLPITSGSFSGGVALGRQHVQIASYKVSRRKIMPDLPDEDVRENILPARYSVDSTLSADIQADSNPPLTFSLESEPGKSQPPPP